MIASLPMYDPLGGDWRIDALWSDIRDAIRARGIAAPDILTRSGDPHADWVRDDLLLSQTCGLPYRARLHERLTLVAAPAIWVPDRETRVHAASTPSRPTTLPAGQYYSVIVTRRNDPRTSFAEYDGARLAYNDALSQSGWGLMSAHAAARGVSFSSGLRTGAHRASALAVFKNQADIAAIDVLSWFGPMANDRWLRDLRIIDRTELSPALPFVTAFPEHAATLLDALQEALSYPYEPGEYPTSPAADLYFAPEGVVPARHQDYMAITLPPAPPTG